MNSCASARSRGRDHVGVVRVGPAVEDVVAHRAVQQRGVLRDHADLRAQAVLRAVRDVLAVDQDAAAFDVVEAQQQVDDRRLARARAADQADLLAGADVQRQVVDDARACRRSAKLTCSKRISPRVTRAASHPARRPPCATRASVLMPSCTVPMCSNSAAISHIIQCEMPFRRSAIAVAAATAPTPTWPCVHSHSVTPAVDGDQRHRRATWLTISKPRDEPHLRVDGREELLHRRRARSPPRGARARTA